MKELDCDGFERTLRRVETSLENFLARRDGIGIQTGPDYADEVQYHMDRELAARTLGREYRILAAVRVALRRVTDGTYGFCQGCNEEIHVRRLIALPWASLCIRCQEKVDSRHDCEFEPEYHSATEA
jgi:DnaK suppressor protein